MGKSIGQRDPGGHRSGRVAGPGGPLIRAAPAKEEPPHDYYHASEKSGGSRLTAIASSEERPRKGRGQRPHLTPTTWSATWREGDYGGSRAPFPSGPTEGRAAPSPHAYRHVCDVEGRGSAPPHAYHLVCDLGGRGDYGGSRAPFRLDLRRGGPRPHLMLTTMSATWREGGGGGSAPASRLPPGPRPGGIKRGAALPKAGTTEGGPRPHLSPATMSATWRGEQ